MRVGMDGNIHTDEEEDLSSSEEEDWGGPRFAAPPGPPLRGGSAHSTAIHSIEEGLDESTSSM